ncbi:hypothetical protein [Actinoallomurus rhizosphaericola]|uniref:hypothetical protein n=1 Tax=Actinoallomurus rhizosphaericola TaxID=2952536 RepID=UPI002091A9F1|nr:hypothetical protein [Actinoallomurus rhizosphaericola]MCO5994197.1 hypothetical protein [Actinoallomurus rhizosphaericola]
MISRTAKLAATVTGAGALVAMMGGIAYAAGVSPANTAITATSTSVKFAGTLSGLSFSVTCTSSTIKFTTPSSGYGPVNISPDPTFSGCTDNFGGTATITANHTNGSWTLLAIASPTSVKITIPKAGVTVSTTTLPGCVVTGAPTAAAPITASYSNSTGKATFTSASVPFSGNAACGTISPTGTATGVYTTSPTVTIT